MSHRLSRPRALVKRARRSVVQSPAVKTRCLEGRVTDRPCPSKRVSQSESRRCVIHRPQYLRALHFLSAVRRVAGGPSGCFATFVEWSELLLRCGRESHERRPRAGSGTRLACRETGREALPRPWSKSRPNACPPRVRWRERGHTFRDRIGHQGLDGDAACQLRGAWRDVIGDGGRRDLPSLRRYRVRIGHRPGTVHAHLGFAEGGERSSDNGSPAAGGLLGLDPYRGHDGPELVNGTVREKLRRRGRYQTRTWARPCSDNVSPRLRVPTIARCSESGSCTR